MEPGAAGAFQMEVNKMKCYCNGIEQYNDYFLMMVYNAGATVEDIINMGNGYSFTGSDGNIYEIEND